MISPMTANTENLKAKDPIKIKIIRNARNRTRQTHPRATMIRPTKVIIKARDYLRRRAIRKGTLSNYSQS